MGEITGINLSALKSKLSPSSKAVFRVLHENARDIIIRDGSREKFEKPLSDLMSECGDMEVETVAESIREIVQHMIECKKGEYLIFMPFLKSISIENGIIIYSLPQEIEDYIKAAAGS